jgi:addiction module HigA family antidote
MNSIPEKSTSEQDPSPAPKHPGELLNAMLKRRQITKRDAAYEMDVKYHSLNFVLQARQRLMPNLAAKLEKAGYGTALWWLEKQNIYDLYIINHGVL